MALNPLRSVSTSLRLQGACRALREPICTCSQGARRYSSFTAVTRGNSSLSSQRKIRNSQRWHSTFAASEPNQGSVSADEMKHFASLAASWWDPHGHSRILHLMNPLRHEWITECLSEGQPGAAQPGSNAGVANPGLDYLDIGCGGGIFAESLARTISQDVSRHGLSAITQAKSITAIDPTPIMIKIATKHAQQDPAISSHLKSGKFKYLNTSLEGLPATLSTPSPKYDVITLFEVLEHVSQRELSQPRFLKQILSMLRPGGWLIGSTIARAFPAYVLHDLIAEAPWPIGVVPKGTHDWHKFVNPTEVKEWSRRGLREIERERSESEGEGEGEGDKSIEMARFKSTGAVYFPGLGWKLVQCLDDYGNYFFAVQRT